ncbi:MAG TPA: DUF2264 domain-containing protein [Burkholderiaceae bacterium]|nr:DUF2264 domain-containing protein [Burkholderiaceae bacterium]
MKLFTLRRLILALLVLGVLGAAAVVVLLPKRTGVEGFTNKAAPIAMRDPSDQTLAAAFADPRPGLPPAAYETVFRYVFEGYAAYRSAGGAYVHYPGMHSGNGRRSDGIEGFARMLPIAAAWLASGRDDRLTFDGKPLSLSESFTQGLVSGTDPASPEYWGDPRDNDQRAVEAADIALGLWLARDHIWKRLSDPQRQAVAGWLSKMLAIEVYDGNWELFPIMVHRVLRALGVDTQAFDERLRTRYEHFKSSYRGDGFFFDPPHGFDFYNAWSIHYELFWLDRIDPDFDPAFIRQASGELAGFFKHLFGPRGYPMMGRSSCYRMAAPTPLVIATALAPQAVSPGEAMRALDLNWSYFMQRGALRDGVVTQGFCGGVDPEILANYSGPASCLWAMRSLIVALVLDARSGLLSAPRAKLPVELGDFTVSNRTAGWTVRGEQSSGNVTIVLTNNAEGPGEPLKPFGTSRKLLEWLQQKPMRPDNTVALYSRREYSTARQPVDCPARP